MSLLTIATFLATVLLIEAHDLTTSALKYQRSKRSLETCECEISLLHQGVYVPDQRFNAFVDGVMINTVSEMKRKKLDPLYFRVHDHGVIEHVPAGYTRGRKRRSIGSILKQDRQAKAALGGGVIRGLSNVKRFGSAEVQIAGNTTLIRSHWLVGPLFIIIDYRGEPSITRVRTEVQAVQFDTLTAIDKFGADMKAFQLYSPLIDYMAYYGNRTMVQQRTTEFAMRNLFMNTSFMVKLLKEAFEVSSYDKIIPQFGVDDNYYSVLEYLFNGQQGRMARISLQNFQEEQQHLHSDNRKRINEEIK